jgi:hypothetical protein
MGELSGCLPEGRLSWTLPGVPRHLQGMLGGGILGAGLGYGAVYLGSRFLPDEWDRSRLPKTMMILGSMAGAAPGLGALASNAAKGPNSPNSAGKSIWTDDALFDAPPAEASRYQQVLPTYGAGADSPAEFVDNPDYDPSMPKVKAGSAVPNKVQRLMELTGAASPQAMMASPNSFRISFLAAVGFSKKLIERSRNLHLKVTLVAHKGTKPSEASTTISRGDRPRGVACPRLSVSQTAPGP